VIASQSVRFYCDDLLAASTVLLTVLVDARVSNSSYTFGGLSPQEILVSGMLIVGDITDIAAQLEVIPGVVRHNE
jgi:hypothetical protein